MPEYQFDAAFEQRLARRLGDFANEAVRPFDAVEIARIAASAPGRGWRSRLPAMPRGWRLIAATALLALGLLGAGILGGFIKLPSNDIAPNPSFSPFSPLPVATTPLRRPIHRPAPW